MEVIVKKRALAEGINVSTQLYPGEITAAKNAGVRTIINNRPDLEEQGQPMSADLQREAHAAGLEYHHIPVVPGALTDSDIERFRDVLGQCGMPILAFCKSGMRAASLWSLAQAGKLPTEEIVRQAASCGYDLAPLVPRIEDRAKKTHV
jgi:sulfide:quinone oxidoreductase